MNTATMPPSLRGRYAPRPVNPAIVARLGELVRLLGADALARDLGVAPNTVRRIALGEPVREFVATSIEASAANL